MAKKHKPEATWRVWARRAGLNGISEQEWQAAMDERRATALQAAHARMARALGGRNATGHDARVAYEAGLSPATVGRYRNGPNAWGKRGPLLTTFLALDQRRTGRDQ